VNDPSSPRPGRRRPRWHRPGRERLAGRRTDEGPRPSLHAGDGREAGASPLEGCLRTPGHRRVPASPDDEEEVRT